MPGCARAWASAKGLGVPEVASPEGEVGAGVEAVEAVEAVEGAVEERARPEPSW